MPFGVNLSLGRQKPTARRLEESNNEGSKKSDMKFFRGGGGSGLSNYGAINDNDNDHDDDDEDASKYQSAADQGGFEDIRPPNSDNDMRLKKKGGTKGSDAGEGPDGVELGFWGNGDKKDAIDPKEKAKKSQKPNSVPKSDSYLAPPEGTTMPNSTSSTIFLDDKNRAIDFVLAYRPKVNSGKEDPTSRLPDKGLKRPGSVEPTPASAGSAQDRAAAKAALYAAYRMEFEKRLEAKGLVLEYEDVAGSQDGKTAFIKIHAPWEVLARTAEINRVKMPIRVNDLKDEDDWKRLASFDNWVSRLNGGTNPFDIDPARARSEPEYFTAAFSRDRADQFLISDKATFFSPVQRIRMVWDLILQTMIELDQFQQPPQQQQQHNGAVGKGTTVEESPKHESTGLTTGSENRDSKDGSSSSWTHSHHKDPVGIKWLLKERVYIAAFPLHDSDYQDGGGAYEGVPPDQLPLRAWLFQNWSIWNRRTWYRYQPLNQIRNYYGEKVSIYFAWLGFYTKMLIPPAIVGTLCFLFGLISHSSAIPHKEICNPPTEGGMDNATICRLCSKTVCPFKTLGSSCLYATLTYIFDNYATVFFALFVSVWAVVFLELWKRYQAELSWQWDVFDMEFVEEAVRPEYQASVKSRRINPVTQQEEPYLPTRSKVQRLIASGASVVFMLFVVLFILAGIIFYRIVGSGLYYQLKAPLVRTISAPILTSMTAAGINAVCILILGKVYERIAWLLTSNEVPRTETDFENSYTYKVFIFEFINYYAALFYIAFIKGKIFGPPTEKGYVDRCDPVGCLIDVCIQLAIIMIVKQTLNNFVEIGFPLITNWWNRRNNVEETEDNKYTRWEKDFDLSPLPQLGLFDEYLEMIIQFGFVTMFVAAFPLAPLFALINNIVEIRLDAYKLTTAFRRPVPARARDIGAWLSVLEIITKTAVITNGLVIAFTSDFIDRMVYVSVYSEDGSLSGYIQHVFSVFNTTSWGDPELSVDASGAKVDQCWYRDYRSSPDGPSADHPYRRTATWWHVLVARLFFVLIFEHVVFLIQGVIQYLIPDIPEHVSVKIQRENFLAKQALYKHEFNNNNNSVPKTESDTTIRSENDHADELTEPTTVDPRIKDSARNRGNKSGMV